MYEAYWGLQERPFQNAPDPRFLFYADSHEEALVRLLYAVSENKGLALLTGSVGTGKTLLTRVFRKELSSRGYEVAVLVNPDLSPEELLRAILAELGAPIPAGGGKPELWDALARHVRRPGGGKPREIVLIVDEAQSITDPRSLETLRMLLNIVDDVSGRFCFTLVLAGQPELRGRVQQSDALCQRVAVACELRALTREETAEYIAHRLRTAGAAGELFTEDAVAAIHKATGGTPRAINTLADLSLLTGSSRQADRVDAECVQAAQGEVLQSTGDPAEWCVRATNRNGASLKTPPPRRRSPVHVGRPSSGRSTACPARSRSPHRSPPTAIPPATATATAAGTGTPLVARRPS